METLEPRTNYLNADYGIRSWLLTRDHKRIAVLYLVSITVMFILGGLFALLVRLELLTPGPDLMSSDTYNKVFTMHGIIMVFFFLIPSIPAVLGNFLIPLMIGARDLAFPRINLLSWYIYVIGGTITLVAMVAGGIDTGWTFYTPYSTMASNTNVIPTAVGIFISGFSSILTGLNFIVTIHRMRAPGLTWFRLPVFVWAHYATSLIMILPPMGVVSELVTCFSRKRVFGYNFIAVSSLAIALLGFLVWAHHMFVTGMSIYAALIFSFLSFAVAIPSAVKVFNWTATLYKGSISYDAPMLYAFGFIGLFTIGGLTGLFLASLGTDVHLTDTYFIVAHFHYIMVGGAIMGYLGGIHFWWPKISGRMYPEAPARIAAVIVFIGFNLTFFPQFILGYLGMPRRYHYYPEEFQVLNVMSTAGATILGLGYLLPLTYLIWSLRYGAHASANPWKATGLEWTTPSPPPTENFHETPMVTHDAYDSEDFDFEAVPLQGVKVG
jgi:cytochrome c oxidase subunit 1